VHVYKERYGNAKNAFCVIKVKLVKLVQVHWKSYAFLRVSFYLNIYIYFFKGEQGAANILSAKRKKLCTNRLSNLNKYSL